MRSSLLSVLWLVLWVRVCGVWGAAMAPMVPYQGRGRDCRCVPNEEFCTMEVLPLSVVAAYSFAPYTCRLGTRLCCETNPAQPDAKKKNTDDLLDDGALIVKVPSLQPYYDLQLRYSKDNNTNEKVSEGQKGVNIESAPEEFTEFHPFHENYPNLTNVQSHVSEALPGASHADKEKDDKSRLTKVEGVGLPVVGLKRSHVNATNEHVKKALIDAENSTLIDAVRRALYLLKGNATRAINSSHKSEGSQSSLWLGTLPTSSTEYSHKDALGAATHNKSVFTLNPQGESLNLNVTKSPVQGYVNVLGNGSLPGASVNESSNTTVSHNTGNSFWLWFWG
ncbi:uncharacterized protein [Procambarus clarkii]|uniref:uncharacterized protein n=1 Tax=Procambarus clarkii TaxID=6728 RepID=UPI001E6772AD|nr:uncharacterized protein LOC123772186 [Procambarus clarkii]